MSKQSKQGIQNDAVDGDKILLLNNQSVRARNFLDSADVAFLKFNASDVPEFLVMPEFGGSPLATTDDIDSDFASKTTDDLSEGASNFYYTSARFNSSFAGKSTSDLSEGSNLYYTAARFNSAFAGKSTSDLTEGSNLYYTQARFDSAFGVAFAAKSTTDLAEGTNFYYTSARFNASFAAKSTTDLSEGTNLYYTAARFNTAFSGKSTTDLTEGTNLYYTAARFNTAFSGKSTTDLAEGTNLYYTAARFNTAFAGKSTTDLAEGSNLYYTNARGIGSVITGYVSGAGTVSATDTILQAIQKLNGNIAAVSGSTVTSVNSVSPVSGNVSLTTSDIPEGTNLYYTAARFNSAFAAKSTTDLSEGSNLYYTNARGIGSLLTGYVSGAGTVAATDSILQAIQKLNGNQVASIIDSIADGDTTHAPSRNAVFDALALKQDAATAVTSVNSVTPTAGNVLLTTTNIAEGTNLYYTAARFNTAFAGKSTTDLAEGTNLYYTAARFNTAFAAKSTTDLAEGTNLYYTNARGIGSVLTGYVSGAGTVAASDTILQAIQKLNGNTALKQDAATAVTSVNSVTPTAGNVVLTTTNVAEGSNLYSTTARTLAALVFSQAVPTGTPNGVLVNFTLPFTPHSDQAMMVFVDAVPKVYTTEWSRSGTTLTFVTAPAAGQQVYVWMLRA